MTPFPRPCRRCGEKHQPYSKSNRICDKCLEKSQRMGMRKRMKSHREKIK